MKPNFTERENSIENEIIAMRRHLHKHPELSGKEGQTSKYIAQTLLDYGVPCKKGYAKTGVLGVIKGERPGGVVALRADIDALPIQEKTTSSFASQNPGKMHACGHDAHTAMLLGTAKLLFEEKKNIPGTVLLVFQPAEENAPIGGAQPMMDDGIFDQYTPDVIYGQHVWPDLPVGTIGVRDGVMMGATERFRITFNGKGGHASMPHQTRDAIMMATTIVNQLQTIVSRNLDPLEAAVLTVGKINGGYQYNVIADTATVEGTVRTLNTATRTIIKERFHQIVNDGVRAMGGTADISFIKGYPSTVNTPKWAQLVRRTTQELLNKQATPELHPSLAGEDFSRFLLKYPGAFFWLGAMPRDGHPRPLHDPYFEFNEEALIIGTELMAQVAVDTLYELEQ